MIKLMIDKLNEIMKNIVIYIKVYIIYIKNMIKRIDFLKYYKM